MNSYRRAIRIIEFGLLLVLVVSMAGCGGAGNSNATSNVSVKKGVKPVPDPEVAVIEMESPAYGPMVIELYPNIAPKMVERFKQLIREGFYNGTTFHRVTPVLGIIQAGDPLSKDDNPANDGSGDSPYPNVPGEFSDIPYDRGIVGAARKGARPPMTEAEAVDTANCQFFITLKRVDGFDGNYTVFGKVIEGLNDAEIIAGAPVRPAGAGRSEASQPYEKLVIKSITLRKR